MAKEPRFSADDVEVLGNAEIRRRKALPTCTNCFTKTETGVDENGECINCRAPEPSLVSGNLEGVPESLKNHIKNTVSNTGYAEYSGTVKKGPYHSPGYLASCHATGLRGTSFSGVELPHPQALGTLPVNHTAADFEHYVTARGGHIDESGNAYIDNRTPEQRDPNHRLYSPTPLLVKTASVPVQTYLPKEAIEAAKPGSRVIQKEGRHPAAGLPKMWQEEWSMSPGGNTFKEYREGLTQSTFTSLSPEQAHEHRTMHTSSRKDYPNTVDHKGNFWTSEPDTCASCNLDQKINEAAFAHPDHGIKAEDPLCPKC
jgi:hypothetical protein